MPAAVTAYLVRSAAEDFERVQLAMHDHICRRVIATQISLIDYVSRDVWRWGRSARIARKSRSVGDT